MNLKRGYLILQLKQFAFLRKLPNTQDYNVIKHQLIKSATSSGANYEESQVGSSRPDFCNKVRISLKERI